MALRAPFGRRVRSRTLSYLTTAVILFASLAALSNGLVVRSPGVEPSAAPATFTDAPPPVGPAVVLSPGSWAMTAGDSVTFSASVTGIAAGCSLVAVVFVWSLPGVSEYEGFLNASVGNSTRFTAAPSASGSANVLAQATGAYRCGDLLESLSASGTAGLGITPGEAAGNLAVYPNPATPGGRVVLQWALSGGTAPYSAFVTFGDGATTVLSVASVGSPFIAHRYPAGVFTPQVEVVDSLGHHVPSSVVEPLVVTSSMAVAISLDTPAVDPGVAFTARANVSGGVLPIAEFWSDSRGDRAGTANWTLTAPAPGNFTLNLEVLDGAGTSLTVSRTVTVAPGPSISIIGTRPTADVGLPFAVSLLVRGGVAPYELNWSIVGENLSNAPVTVSAPGTYLEPVVSGSPGEVWATAQLRDAAGALRSTTVPVAQAFEPPRATVMASQATVEVGRTVTLTAVLDQGAPPVNWSMVTSLPASNDSPSHGSIAGPGTFRWEGSFPAAGPVQWYLVLTDSAGSSAAVNGTVAVLASLQAELVVPHASVLPLSSSVVSAALSGGLPPYRFSFVLGDGEVTSGNLSQPGTARFNVSPAVTGNLSVDLRVVDALGVESAVHSALFVASSPSSPPSTPPSAAPPTAGGAAPSSVASWVVGVGGLGAAVAVFFVPRWRQRTKRRPGGGNDTRAMGVVRRLLKDTDGLERETLYFLADEEGVTTDAASVAVDRWCRAGRLRVDPGTEGQDLLLWVEPGAPSPSADLAPETEVDG